MTATETLSTKDRRTIAKAMGLHYEIICLRKGDAVFIPPRSNPGTIYEWHPDEDAAQMLEVMESEPDMSLVYRKHLKSWVAYNTERKLTFIEVRPGIAVCKYKLAIIEAEKEAKT